MTSTIVKRSIVLCGHKTSVSLEDEFWISLRQLAASKNTNVTMLVEQIAHDRNGSNLSSAIRVFLFNHSRGASPRESPSDKTLHTMRWLLAE